MISCLGLLMMNPGPAMVPGFFLGIIPAASTK
jgi:hypothetical protein